MSLTQMSVSAGVMILAIMVIRVFAINRLPKKTFVLLWAAVLLRLLIPFSIPSMLSAYSFVEKNTMASKTLAEISAGNAVLQAAGEQTNINTNTTEIFLLRDDSVFSILHVLWMIGMTLCAVFFLISYVCCYAEFRMSLPVQNEFVNRWLAAHRLKRKIQIRQSDKITSPLTYGIFHPVILMPKKTDWQNQQQLQYVLLHEYVHICRFDIILKLVGAAALCIHWFNPLVWVMYTFFNRDIELSCDESVVRMSGKTSGAAYAMVLISMEEKKAGLLPFCNNFSKNAIEERITAIMKTKKITVFAILVSAAIVTTIIVLFATSGQKETEAKTQPVYAVDKQKEEPVENISRQKEELAKDVNKNVREAKMMIPYEAEETQEALPAALYTGEGFSMYIPDEEYTGKWLINDKDLEPPYVLEVVLDDNPKYRIIAAHYADKMPSDVEAVLMSEGYRYDTITGLYQKLDEDQWIAWDARIFGRVGEESDFWIIYTSYDAGIEWGSRMDAIANTFAITENTM